MRVSKKPISAALVLLCASYYGLNTAEAIEFDTGNTDLKARWDNTVTYSTARRTKSPSSRLTSDINLDDGDRNFRGMISNRVDLLSELDVTYKNFGARVSAAGWYDDVYNQGTKNNSLSTVNSYSVAPGRFPDETRKLHGRNAEILDAYVFGRFDLGNSPTTLRLGKHTLLYGENLFFGSNGIAGAQAPVDVIKALSVPGSQVKEVLRPVNQLSVQSQLTPQISMGAYYQLEWKANRLPGAGSYFAPLDMGGPGAERFFVGDGAAFFKQGDMKAKDSGQFGAQLRFRPSGGDIEYGLYALKFHSKTPALYLYPGDGFNPVTGQVGATREVYAENIKLYGMSASTTINDIGVAGEISVRRNNPLLSTGQMAIPGVTNNSNDPGYAVGNTAHAQVSALYSLPRNAIWDSASIAGEVAWARVTSVTKNAQALEPLGKKDGLAFRMIIEPSYFQVLPGLDISVPVGVGYTPKGKSWASSMGANRSGDISIGIKGDYLKTWRFGVSYTHYFGPEGTIYDGSANYTSTFKQWMKDRDFISLNVQRTF